MKIKIALSTFILCTSFALGQENYIDAENSIIPIENKIKRISLGVKFGIPSIASGAGEIILPIFKNHIAPYIDYSKIELALDDIDSNFSFLEYGVNFYTSEKGYGFFVGIGKSVLDSELMFKNLDFGLNGAKGSATIPFDLETTNFKVGVKTGGTFYLKFDLGYGIGNIPDSIDFTATSNGISKSFSEEIPPLPGVGVNGILLGSFGLGFSF